MHIFYYCPTGVHTALVAAGLHLGLLPDDEFARDHVIQLPYFDTLATEGLGMPRYIGNDERDNPVYTVGVAMEEEVVIKTIKSLLSVCHIPVDSYHLVGATHYVHPLTRMGCFLNRHGITSIGTNLVEKGLEKNYHRLRDLVHEVKSIINIH